ncbi:methyltransferase domain-containing protein [Arthrobacter sp. UYEF21]|uniref:methyltransferase domain-containing protein n=1 Tax=Arthrobacter sp. UYEF21 TaxID=1756364 RepID=UPI003398A4F5
MYRAGRILGIDALDPRPGDQILDIGCGTGLNFPLLQDRIGPAGTIIGIDRSPGMLRQAQLRGHAPRLGQRHPGPGRHDQPRRPDRHGPDPGPGRGSRLGRRPRHLIPLPDAGLAVRLDKYPRPPPRGGTRLRRGHAGAGRTGTLAGAARPPCLQDWRSRYPSPPLPGRGGGLCGRPQPVCPGRASPNPGRDPAAPPRLARPGSGPGARSGRSAVADLWRPGDGGTPAGAGSLSVPRAGHPCGQGRAFLRRWFGSHCTACRAAFLVPDKGESQAGDGCEGYADE